MNRVNKTGLRIRFSGNANPSSFLDSLTPRRGKNKLVLLMERFDLL